MSSRFRVILPSGNETELRDVPDLVEAFRTGKINEATMLHDALVGRWMDAGDHDVVAALQSEHHVEMADSDPAGKSQFGSGSPASGGDTGLAMGYAATSDRDQNARADEFEYEEMLERLAAYVGPNWDSHFKKPFASLLRERLEPPSTAGWTWNWPAALVPLWFLYRRLYAPFFGFLLLYGLISAIDSAAAGTLDGGSPFALLFFGQAILMGWAGDRLLFRKAYAEVIGTENVDLLKERGTPNAGCLWGLLLAVLVIVVGGIIAAIMIPQF